VGSRFFAVLENTDEDYWILPLALLLTSLLCTHRFSCSQCRAGPVGYNSDEAAEDSI